MSDAFSFLCDLDRNMPEGERAALTVMHDGEHVVFAVSGTGEAFGREVYLTPDMAGHLAGLLGMLTDPGDGDAPPRLTLPMRVALAMWALSFVAAVVLAVTD